MKRIAFLIISLPIISSACFAQPYGGTIFIESDIINSSDSSSLQSVSYAGRGVKTVFDRRVNDWVSNDAYLFDVIWNDGLSSVAVINPEFESVELAQAEAEKYGYTIGQLPACLRTDVNEIWIHKGVELFGGGNFSILIHAGQSENYEQSGILEETLVHEAAHTSLDADHASSQDWINAQDLDGEFISDYAEDYPLREDIAESLLMWMAIRYRKDRISTSNYNIINQTIPNRINYFDSMDFNMSPFQLETDPVGLEKSNFKISGKIYPNPANDFIRIDMDESCTCQLNILNTAGVLVQSETISNLQYHDISSLPAGIYVLDILVEGEKYREKLYKY